MNRFVNSFCVLILVFCGLCGVDVLASNQIFTSTKSELLAAVKSAKPGDEIILRTGVWKDVVVDFSSRATAKQPVTLRAEVPGKVIWSGHSVITFSKPHLVVDGLVFKNGSTDKDAVISFQSDSCRLTNTAIINYNPSDFTVNYYWVYFMGSHNRMDHCFFTGKNNQNPVVGNDNENSRYNRVDSCYIKDIPYIKKANGREIFRIFGYGHADETGDDGAYFTIEYNLFEHAHGEGTEIVSLKSNYNIVRYNTVIASRGGLVGRRGRNNTFEGNFILGQGEAGTTGIRVAGANHRVVNNYVCDVDEDGLRLIAGEYYEKSLTKSFAPKKKELPKYLQVQNGYFAHNTIINCGGNGIDVGFGYEKNWPNLQMVLLPENNRIVNNVVFTVKEKLINIEEQDKTGPLKIFSFQPNYFENNIVFAGQRSDITGVKYENPHLSFAKDGLYRPSPKSVLLHHAAASDVNTDMDGQFRGALKDIGADQVADGAITIHPLSANEVGPKWMMNRNKK